ncbi:MAG: zinc ribbon domain-containing protein [Anaerolineae bacterium]|nr:zinc ribbon domain-containing protein [Anaerolineae bacterium]
MSDNFDSSGTTPSRRHDAGTYQMLWDCRFCGAEKLLGITHRHCPNCGAAQDPEWRYFPAEEDMIALEDHEYVGADKICPACGQPNSAACTYCGECGADLATGEVAQTRGERAIGTGVAESDTRRDVVQDQFVAEMQRVGVMKGPRTGGLGLSRRSWIIIGGVLLAVVAAIIFAITYRKEASGTVDRLEWARTIEIEDFRARAGSDWDESVPGDAYNMSCHERQRGTERVQVGSHQECRDVDQGDGSFRRQCNTVADYEQRPVYDDWCTFTVDRWDTAREVEAQGTGKNPAPYWPEYTLATATGRYGEEREGSRDETYIVVIREDDGDKHECELDDMAEWEKYSEGASVSLKLKITGGADCDTLKIAE